MSSKPGSFMRLIGALSAGALLAACMTEQAMPARAGHGPMMGGHAGAATASGAPPAGAGHGPMMGGHAGAATASGAPVAGPRADEMDMRGMCRMQQEMQQASPAERQAMMERHMQGMSPEMRRHQMEMMQQHCR